MGPDGTLVVGPIGPFPSGVTGEVAFATLISRTTSTRAYTQTEVHVIDMADPVDRVIFTAEDLIVEGLTWAPDGKHLVMQSHKFQPPGPNGENRDIFRLRLLDLAGTQDLTVFDGPGPELAPAYSAAGRLAYFARWNTDPASGIFIDGSPAHSTVWLNGNGLSWAPDGTALVFTWGPGLSRLTLADGSVTQLVAAATDEWIMRPSYSPDGTRIAMTRFGGDHEGEEIWTTSATGTDAVQVTKGFADEFPGWTPDGNYIVFSRSSGSASGIYLVASAGGTPNRVVGVGGGFLTQVAWSR
jgi:Tol biopolymer transport system component